MNQVMPSKPLYLRGDGGVYEVFADALTIHSINFYPTLTSEYHRSVPLTDASSAVQTKIMKRIKYAYNRTKRVPVNH
jgi:hypothetical protein